MRHILNILLCTAYPSSNWEKLLVISRPKQNSNKIWNGKVFHSSVFVENLGAKSVQELEKNLVKGNIALSKKFATVTGNCLLLKYSLFNWKIWQRLAEKNARLTKENITLQKKVDDYPRGGTTGIGTCIIAWNKLNSTVLSQSAIWKRKQ